MGVNSLRVKVLSGRVFFLNTLWQWFVHQKVGVVTSKYSFILTYRLGVIVIVILSELNLDFHCLMRKVNSIFWGYSDYLTI